MLLLRQKSKKDKLLNLNLIAKIIIKTDERGRQLNKVQGLKQ